MTNIKHRQYRVGLWLCGWPHIEPDNNRVLLASRATSLSLIAPTAVWMILTRTPSTSVLRKLPAKASTEPWTSGPIIVFLKFTLFHWIKLSKCEPVYFRSSINACLARCSPASRAVFSSSKTTKRSPSIRHHSNQWFQLASMDGFLNPLPWSLVIVRTFP